MQYNHNLNLNFDTNFCCDVHALTANLLEGGEDSDMKLVVFLSPCLLAAPYLSRKSIFWTYANELSTPVTLSSVTFSLNINGEKIFLCNSSCLLAVTISA